MKSYFLGFSLLFFLLSCNSHKKQKLKNDLIPPIIELPQLSWTDSSKTDTGFRIAKFYYYLVKCNGFDSNEIRTGIDQFARNAEATIPCAFAQCNMLYFKETEETNEKSLYANKELIDAYSTKHDLIFEYVWNFRQLIGVNQYKEGLIVNPKARILIRDVSDSLH